MPLPKGRGVGRRSYMDIGSKELVERLQAQIAEIVFRLQAISANLNMLSGLRRERGILPGEESVSDGENSIHEKGITCLECGRVCRVITRRHLASHGLTACAYRMKWGLKHDTPLMCRELLRARRERMQTMKLWERRHNLRRKKRQEDA